MNIQYAFKNIDASEHLKEHCRSRFEKLAKYLGGADNVELQVNMSVDKFRHVVEVVLNGDFLHISAMEQSDDMYASVDMVLDKLEAQLARMREKLKQRAKRSGARAVEVSVMSASDEGWTRAIVDSDRVEAKPMSVDEAASRLEAAKTDDFLVFINAETDRPNVLYRMKNGDYGLIDPGFSQGEL